jgi:hypothetical protein
MPTKKAAAKKPSNKRPPLTKEERSKMDAAYKSIIERKQAGFILLVTKEGKNTLGVMGSAHKFEHNDVHRVIEFLIEKVHPEIAALGELLNGIGALARAERSGKKGK